MSGVGPVRVPRRDARDPFGGHRLERVMGYRPASPGPVSAVVDSLGAVSAGVPHVASYIAATHATPTHVCEATTAIHILWVAPGVRAEVRAGHDPHGQGDLLGYQVHPGDTVSVPALVPFALGPGIVGFTFGGAPARVATNPSAWSRGLLRQLPTHGLNLFDGFNRRTICAAHNDLLLERWKVTQPLELTLRRNRWHYLTNLVSPVALNWPGGSTIVGRMESRFLPAGLERITLIPDGLGYVLVGSVPDVREDVVGPLRRAGYDRAAIGSLGVPSSFLGEDIP